MICAECHKEFDKDDLNAHPFAMLLDDSPAANEIKQIDHPLCTHCYAFNTDGSPKIWFA